MSSIWQCLPDALCFDTAVSNGEAPDLAIVMTTVENIAKQNNP